ncbi:MAG: KpsF/GutQ family sugar-phosphate isomerase [Zoogloeaceae bacterium]|jgi:arabinose-5-phosphate isomerase|nr:KpsF/GutQ family sugar-phosphate isomerase [Zoogloeaceae bacterium]
MPENLSAASCGNFSPDVDAAHLETLAARTLKIEIAALENLIPRLAAGFVDAVRLILAAPGRVIVSGMGKSGHIARKIAATLASTGTPAYFVHPGEASHGDLGMVQAGDVVLALSYSGETEEVLRILPAIKRQGARLIALTGNPASSLARQADAHLDASVTQEACPLNLAPTASTTAALALGDALAVALLDARGFGAEDFARSHPGGSLGRRLLTHVRDVMRPAQAVPQIAPEAPLTEAILAMTAGGLGMVVITDASQRILGIFTDGDLRRAFARPDDFRAAEIATLMRPDPRRIAPEKLAAEAAELMERHRISQVLVAGEDGILQGALNMHDLMRAKVI